MKRCLTIFIIAVLALGITILGLSIPISYLLAPKDSILNSLPDYIDKEFYSSGGFQDYTDYGKYTYQISEMPLIHNSYFLRVSEENIPEILSYIENFEGWVEITEFPSEKYDFDKSVITEGDYFYILSKYDEPGQEFYDYNVYYFDLDAQILYYFHNNI